jgi:hypothetical protein
MIATYSVVSGSTLIPVVDDHPLGEKQTPGRLKKHLVGR